MFNLLLSAEWGIVRICFAHDGCLKLLFDRRISVLRLQWSAPQELPYHPSPLPRPRIAPHLHQHSTQNCESEFLLLNYLDAACPELRIYSELFRRWLAAAVFFNLKAYASCRRPENLFKRGVGEERGGGDISIETTIKYLEFPKT